MNFAGKGVKPGESLLPLVSAVPVDSSPTFRAAGRLFPDFMRRGPSTFDGQPMPPRPAGPLAITL